MADSLFDEMVVEYSGGDLSETENAVRETMQVVALAGLNRGGFFEQAAFYGGTCLRVFYGLDRYSEDMDFSLLAPSSAFSLEPFFQPIIDEFALVGRPVTINEKRKSSFTAINSAFLKDNTQVYDLHGQLLPKIKIKIEIDTDPLPMFSTEYKLSLRPYSFMTRCYALSSSFAGKMTALMYRAWHNRIKGRDWYDFEWYVRKGVTMDLGYFNRRAIQQGKLMTGCTPESFKELLREKIAVTDITAAKRDVAAFISDESKLEIWSQEYFLQILDMMQVS
jgi:predicted nucleotidyltransferase component of viral defense system